MAPKRSFAGFVAKRKFAKKAPTRYASPWRPPMALSRRAPATRVSMSLGKQIRSLVASKKRDAADQERDVAVAGTTEIRCLTSSSAAGVAASGSGILDMDGDECLINKVRIKGEFTNLATLDLDPSNNKDGLIRQMVVWFNKPLLVASAAGTLPPITEVLTDDLIDALPISDAVNGGRFKILSNKVWNMGTNTFQANTAVGHARCSGRTHQQVDYTVKVGRVCKFAKPSRSGTLLAGHYDSDVSDGRIATGLLVMYTQSSPGGNTLVGNLFTRLNYTG